MLQISNRAAAHLPPNLSVTEVPTKFLVNFIDRASLEEPDSPMVDLWAGLLASAAENHTPEHIFFTSIIASMSSQQGLAFQGIFRRGRSGRGDLDVGADEIDVWRFGETYIYQGLESTFPGPGPATFEELEERFNRYFESYAVHVASAHASNAAKNTIHVLQTPFRNCGANILDLDILVSLGLLRYIKVQSGHGDWTLDIDYYLVTKIGIAFAVACRIVRPYLNIPPLDTGNEVPNPEPPPKRRRARKNPKS